MCLKPGCNKHSNFNTSPHPYFCADCYYPGIDEDYKAYRGYREDGYGIYQSKVMVGWSDVSEGNYPTGDYDD